jgi:hypothetical protein
MSPRGLVSEAMGLPPGRPLSEVIQVVGADRRVATLGSRKTAAASRPIFI